MFGITDVLAEIVAAPITVPVKAMEKVAEVLDEAIS
jgi:hypothetical protein